MLCSTGTAGMNVNVTTIGCTVLMQWNKETHSEFYIDIWNAKGKDHLGIETSRSRFTYADVQPGQSYKMTWTPIRNNTREREFTLKEENYVVIPKGKFTTYRYLLCIWRLFESVVVNAPVCNRFQFV